MYIGFGLLLSLMLLISTVGSAQAIPLRAEFSAQPAQVSAPVNINGTWYSGFYYLHVAGSSLRPRSSSGWATDSSGGCIYATNSNNIFNVHIQLPEAARVDYLRIYYNDTSVSMADAWLTTYDGAGGKQDVAYVGSAGTEGYGFQVSSLANHIVDNYNQFYALNWQPNIIGPTMQLCGLRLAYRVPVNAIFVPLIMR